MKMIKENELIKLKEKGLINYELPVDIYEVPSIKTFEDAKITRLPINYIYLTGKDGVKVFKRDQDVLVSLQYPNATMRFKKYLKFDDYYNENNIYKKDKTLNLIDTKYAEMFNIDTFRYPIKVELNSFISAYIYEFNFDEETRIFLTDEELFSIRKIEDYKYLKGGYRFISLPKYNYENKRIWFLIDSSRCIAFDNGNFMICPLDDKYFNEFNGSTVIEELGHFKYPAKKYTNVEEKKETIIALDLRPSQIEKISQALFTIANYNDKKVTEENYKADERLLVEKEKLNLEKMSGDLKLHISIIIDYYENCLTNKQLKEKYEVGSHTIDRAILFRYPHLQHFDVSIINRKRALTIREKRLLEIYHMISEEDKNLIIEYIDKQLKNGVTNISYKEYENEPAYPHTINKKYNLNYSDYPVWYGKEVLYKLIYKKVKHYPDNRDDIFSKSGKLSNLILQVSKL